MAELWGKEVAKWTKLTDENESKTADIVTDSAGVDRLAVSPCEKTTTTHFNGVATTTPIDIPSVAGNQITTVLIKNKHTNAFGELLSVSFDGGTTYFDLRRREYLVWSMVDDLSQIKIKGSTATVDYQILMNRESS